MPTIVKCLLGEARGSKAFTLISQIAQLSGYKSVEIFSQADGYSVLLRAEDGQAYEVQVRPAAYAKNQGLNAFYGTGKGTRPASSWRKAYQHRIKDAEHKAP